MNAWIALFVGVTTGNHPLGMGHEVHETAPMMKIGAVKKHVLASEVVRSLRGLFGKPVIFDRLEFGRVVAGKFGQLADRIAFSDPKLKPIPLFETFVERVFPNKGFKTVIASEPLPVLGAFAVQLDATGSTVRAMLFLT